MMNLVIFKFILLWCGLSLAQDDLNEGQPCPECSDLLKEMDAMKEKLRSVEIRLTNSETQLKESQNHFLALQQEGRTKIIFSATLDGHTSVGPFNTDITLKYTHVITNVGNAYNRVTGIFEAPFTGVYYLIFFAHFGEGYPLHLSLFKNGQVITQCNDHKASRHNTGDNGGNAVFLELQKGDQVYVRMFKNTHVWGFYQTSFSGSLVYRI